MSIALITGSAQGIGRGIALRLAKDGFDIALNDLASKRDQLRAVAGDIEKIGRRTLLVPGDVSVEKDVKGMVQDVAKELGGLDVMIANAGTSRVASLLSTSVDDWNRVMAVNARGPFLCYKYAAQQMITQGRGGRIIGISSILGKRGLPLVTAYSASKFAVRGLTHTAALELGRHKITVNSCAPGPIETSIYDHLNDVPECDLELVKELMDGLASGVIKHKGQPEDVASLVSYLSSKEAHFITAFILKNYMSVVKKGIALITDSARGIGRAIALRLAKDGFDIALNDVASKFDQLYVVVSDIERIGRKTLLVPGDISVEEDVKRMVQDASKELGGLNIMVANAGIPFIKSMATTSADDWDRAMAVNARQAILVLQLCSTVNERTRAWWAHHWREFHQRKERVFGAFRVWCHRVSSPLEVLRIALVRSIFLLLLPDIMIKSALGLGRYNITVNCYAPGPIETPMITALNDIPESDLELFEELRDLTGTLKRPG
ncbi:NAD(P)-binding protein [Chiua virens]|nr:NAD(P)-binding protein [Chiua virens]